MTGQLSIDWDATVRLPIAGKSVQARHASSTGAQKAARDRGQVALAYRALLIEAGPHSDHEAAQILRRGLSSVCSVRNDWLDKVAPSGQFETHVWPDGSVTKRCRWAWAGER